MRARQILTTLTAALALAALLALSPAAPARAERDGFVTFDRGADGATIAISGLSFSAGEDAGWVYGDVGTRRYNAPYPADCSGRPGNLARPVCEYAVAGSGFAWTGQLGGQAAFSFTQGTATYVEASFSTGASLRLVAYDPDGEVVAVAVVRANAGTGNLERVRLEADPGYVIDAVVISGSPNFWLMDDLATDAPGVPNQLPLDDPDPALVVVTQSVALGADTALGRLATYTVVARNVGPGDAEDAVVTMPFDPSGVRVVDAAFSRGGAWVSAVTSDTLSLRSGALARGGGVVTATLRLQLLREPPAGGAPGARLAVTWTDRAGGGRGQSNLPFLAAAPHTPRADLGVTPPAGPAGATHTFASGLFVPGEPVALWYEGPGGAVAAGRVVADGEGGFGFTFATGGLAPGRYTMVAHGVSSGMTSVGAFQVTP